MCHSPGIETEIVFGSSLLPGDKHQTVELLPTALMAKIGTCTDLSVLTMPYETSCGAKVITYRTAAGLIMDAACSRLIGIPNDRGMMSTTQKARVELLMKS